MRSSAKEAARRSIAAGFAFLLRMRSRQAGPIGGPILVVAPHPDDETLGCGGLIARQAAAGAPVSVLFLTDGEASHPEHPRLTPAEVGQQRRAEALAALGALGVRDPEGAAVFAHAPDGALDRLDVAARQAVLEAIAAAVRRVRPTVVCAPFRGGGSSEHRAACELVIAAARGGGRELWEYPIWAWWNAFRLRPRLAARGNNVRLRIAAWREAKRRALACHRSQVEPTPPWTEPRLPGILRAACCGPDEFYFRSVLE